MVAVPRFSRPPNRAGAALALLAWLPWAACGAMDPSLERRYGGVYSSACQDPVAPRLKLYSDTMAVERGGRAVLSARNVKASASPPPGAAADFRARFVGEVPGGDRLSFALFHNAQGLFAVPDGGPRSAAALGADLRGQRLRHCDPNRNRLPGAAPPPAERAPADYLRDARFKAAYQAVLGPLAQQRWIARLEGPAPPVKQVKAAGVDHDLLAVCKPHDCGEHSLVLLYSPSTGGVAGKVVQAGRSMLLGQPSPAVKAELERAWKREWRP
jgi:hypothetical protein